MKHFSMFFRCDMACLVVLGFFSLVKGQFYTIIPPQKITFNYWPLNSTNITLGALLPVTNSNNELVSRYTVLDMICIECQLAMINSDPDLLPNVVVNVDYYDTSYSNTSQATITALEYSLFPNQIATFGPEASDLILPMVKYMQSQQIAAFSPQVLSTSYSNILDFPNLRVITVSDFYFTQNYINLLKFFGWTWVAAAFSDDDVGQSGRYSFAALADQGVYYPCFYIISTDSDAGIKSLVNCLRNYTDVQVLLLWGQAESLTSAFEFLYNTGGLDYLTFVISPAATSALSVLAPLYPHDFLQGTVFLGENYDQSGGFTDCMQKFATNQGEFSSTVQELFEKTNLCKISNDTSMPVCNTKLFPLSQYQPQGQVQDQGECRCNLDWLSYVGKPFTQTPIMYRDILQAYALGLHQILHNCDSLKGMYCDLEQITGLELLGALSQISFVGYSGLISFNVSESTSRVNGTLNVYQAIMSSQVTGEDASYTGPSTNGSLVFSVIGFMVPYSLQSTAGIYLDQSLFHFKTGGNTVPLSIPTPETTDLNSGFWPCFIMALCIFGLVMVVVSTIFVVWRWDEPLIRKAGRIFLLQVLVGIALVLVGCLLWCLQASLVMCRFKAAFLFIGVTLTCGALFGKAVEYYLIFTNCRRRAYDQARVDRFLTYLVCVGVVVVNTLIWMLLYLLVAGPMVCESFQSGIDYYYWYVGCLTQNADAGTLYLILWISFTTVINFVAIILLAISWDIVSVFGLARCVVFVECNLIVLAITLMPLYFSLPEYPKYALEQFLVRSLSSVFAAYFTIVFIFCPLMYSYFSPDDQETSSNGGSNSNRRSTRMVSGNYDSANLRSE